MRRTVEVETARGYSVAIGDGLLESVAGALEPYASAALLTDANVEGLFASKLTGTETLPRFVVPAGEDSKRLAVVEEVCEFLCGAGLDRGSCLVALGGGVVGDLGGLCAALFMRGIDFVQVPTTLLAQVDSSVGGKTAVNLAAGKNLVGSFHQPAAVFADTSTLGTLSDEEFASGLGEVIKTAMLAGPKLFERLEAYPQALLARDPELLADIVEACVRHKARVVAEDEREGGLRKSLNLGHTFAHGIEHAAGYGRIPHGVAVGVGLGLAADFAGETELAERVRALLTALSMPARLSDLRSAALALEPDALLAGMAHDKKSVRGSTRLVLPRALGRVEWDVEARPEELVPFLG